MMSRWENRVVTVTVVFTPKYIAHWHVIHYLQVQPAT